MVRSTQFLLSFLVLSVLAACNFDPTVTVPVTTTPGADSSVISCSAMLSPAAGSSVASGVAAPIQVNATGGTAPYQILNTAINFTTQTVISRTYTNNTNANVVEVDSVGVTDQDGHATQCNFLVTVTPPGMPSTLACTLVPTPASPAISQNVSYLATASGGTAPYNFSNLNLGTDSTVVTPLAAASTTTATAVGKFNSAGLRSSSVQLTDNTGTLVTCATSINVATAASVSVAVSPASSVAAGITITLTATPAGFSTTPTYSFTTTQAGVTIASSGNVATVKSSSTQPNFNVVVTATAGSQLASTTVQNLSFSAPGSLACSIVAPSGLLYTNSNVEFDVVATSPATDPLIITYFATTSDATAVTQTDASRTVAYSVAGVKTVLIQAKSKTTGALCQAGATMSTTVEITPAVSNTLSCAGYTTINPTYTYQYTKAYALISNAVGASYVQNLRITAQSFPYNNANSGYWIDATSARLFFYYSGSYLIQFNIRDSAGNTGSCTTTQVVW